MSQNGCGGGGRGGLCPLLGEHVGGKSGVVVDNSGRTDGTKLKPVGFTFIAQKRIPKIVYLSSWGTKVVLGWPVGGLGAGQPGPRASGGPLKYHSSTPRTQVPYLRYPFLRCETCLCHTSNAPAKVRTIGPGLTCESTTLLGPNPGQLRNW